MKQEITELLQDLQEVLTDVQGQSGGKIVPLETAVKLRTLRGRVGVALEELTNEATIIQSSREDAIDALTGITKHMIVKDYWTDNDLQVTRLGLVLAANRIGRYFRALNSPKTGAAVNEPAAQNSQGGMA